MKRLSAVSIGIFFFLFWLPAVICQTPTQTKQTPTSPHPARKQQGFFDYVLGKVNPNGNDYGASMQVGRDAVVEHSIDDLYFWSNAMTLLLLTGVSSIAFLQWRSADKREVIAASLIAQLWNGRVSDRIELERRTEQFNKLTATHNAEVERALVLKSQSSEQENESTRKLNKNVRSLAGKDEIKGNKDAAAGAAKSEVISDATPDMSAVNLQQSNLLLQRRVEAMQNNEQNLKQRLNQTTLLLDQERRRNATLKGA
jgi:hypothetical protein